MLFHTLCLRKHMMTQLHMLCKPQGEETLHVHRASTLRPTISTRAVLLYLYQRIREQGPETQM